MVRTSKRLAAIREKNAANLLACERQAEEEKDPLQIFPAELWEIILKYVASKPYNLQQLLATTTTCKLFYDQLQEILPFWNLAQVIPLVMVWLSPKDLKTCRLICQPIRKCVDRILENLPLLNPQENRQLYNSRFLPPFRKESFDWDHFRLWLKYPLVRVYARWTLDMLRRHIEEVATSTAIVGKSLEICLHCDSENSGITPNHYGELLQFQNFVRHVTIKFSDSRRLQNFRETYEVLRKALEALPKIQSCNIILEYLDPSKWPKIDMQTHIAMHPLPVLENLQTLKIKCDQLPAAIFKEIATRYGKQIKMMTISAPSQDDVPKRQRALKFPSLSYLKLINRTVENLELIRFQADNLKELHLTDPCHGNPLIIKNILSCLQKCPKVSTIRLRVSTLDYPFFESTSKLEFFFESVKHLDIVAITHWMPLNTWTKLFPRLETLKITQVGVMYLLENFYADIWVYRKDLNCLSRKQGHMLDIWKLPSLKMLEYKYEDFCGRPSSRKGYKLYAPSPVPSKARKGKKISIKRA